MGSVFAIFKWHRSRSELSLILRYFRTLLSRRPDHENHSGNIVLVKWSSCATEQNQLTVKCPTKYPGELGQWPSPPTHTHTPRSTPALAFCEKNNCANIYSGDKSWCPTPCCYCPGGNGHCWNCLKQALKHHFQLQSLEPISFQCNKGPGFILELSSRILYLVSCLKLMLLR